MKQFVGVLLFFVAATSALWIHVDEDADNSNDMVREDPHKRYHTTWWKEGGFCGAVKEHHPNGGCGVNFVECDTRPRNKIKCKIVAEENRDEFKKYRLCISGYADKHSTPQCVTVKILVALNAKHTRGRTEARYRSNVFM